MAEPHIVIVGAGPAGGSAAQTLRDEGFEGRVTLLGAEAHRPYIRPPLSKQYLRGEVDRESVFLNEASWYADNNVEFRSGTTIVRLDLAGHLIHTAEGEALPYDLLLVTTGSTPRRLTLEGADLPGVHSLRTLGDSEALHEQLASGGQRLVLIGSGWIGMEVAASARALGNEVTILERDPIPLANAIGDELGSFLANEQTRLGNILRPSVEVRAITGASGRANGVLVEGGEIIPADLVLVGVGATPNVALAEAAGLEVDNGILVDARLATSDPNVFAGGDVAHALHPIAGVRIRSEHLSNALKGGKAAARTMLHADAQYDDLPTFVSEQFDVTVQFAGFAPLMKNATRVVRGDVASRSFSTFWLRDGHAVAGVHINVPDREKWMEGLIRSGRPIDSTRLQDARVPLDQL